MEELRARLERFVDEQGERCCGTTVDERVEELTELRETSAMADDADDVAVFSALANRTRYDLLRLFVAASRELCVCEFAPLFDVSDSTISQALGQLVDAGLVYREASGRWRLYGATERGERIVQFVDGLDADETGDSDRSTSATAD